MKKLIILGAFLIICFDSFACIEIILKVDKVMKDSTVTFMAFGQVARINNMKDAWENNVEAEYSFEVEQFWKGNLNSSQVLIYEDLPCISNFKEGRKYLVFGQSRSDSLIIWGSSDQMSKVEYLRANYTELEISLDNSIFYLLAGGLVLLIGIVIYLRPTT